MVHRVRVEWTGFPGGPGLSTFYVTDGPTAVGPISSFFTAIRNNFPIDVHINVPATGDVLDPITGLITGEMGWRDDHPVGGQRHRRV